MYCRHPRNAALTTGLCEECLDRLELLKVGENACHRCASPLDENGNCTFCKQHGLGGIRQGLAPFYYKGVAQHLILLLKFHFQDEPAQVLAQYMLPLIAKGEYDALVPVPLHARKQRARGANQAETLCRLLSPKAGLPLLMPLKRTRYTRPQKNLSVVQRQRNVRDAFVLTDSVQGLRILLVDDIRTTGATARECAMELLRGKAKSVTLLTAAIATRDDE